MQIRTVILHTDRWSALVLWLVCLFEVLQFHVKEVTSEVNGEMLSA